MSQRRTAAVATRLLDPYVVAIIRRLARVAGCSYPRAMQAAIDQRATGGRTRFSIRTRDGCVATYDPDAGAYR